jgi:hypothetical protein
MSEFSQRNRICLSREIEGNKIEVWINSEEEFGQGFELLQRLSRRLEIEKLKVELQRVWIQSDKSSKISSSIEEGPYRVAVSLFAAWPDEKRVSEIQSDTGLSSGSVSNICAGRQGGLGLWFDKAQDGWRLSEEGVSGVIKTIVPIIDENR